MVDHLVASGRYQNASEVLRSGLRLVEREEAESNARLKALREAARLGIADAKAGRFHNFELEADLGDHLEALVEEELGLVRTLSKR